MNQPERLFGYPRKIAYYAILTSLAFVLSAAEALIPIPAPAPGVKLGLANTVTLFLLLDEHNPVYALIVTIMRCVLVSFALGALSVLLYSLAGGIVSCLVMWILLHFDNTFSVMGASVAGALAHNFSQLAAASFIARDPAIFSYFPVLLVTGAAAGCATGYIAFKARNILRTIAKNK